MPVTADVTFVVDPQSKPCVSACVPSVSSVLASREAPYADVFLSVVAGSVRLKVYDAAFLRELAAAASAAASELGLAKLAFEVYAELHVALREQRWKGHPLPQGGILSSRLS
jgi:hypothetical protein